MLGEIKMKQIKETCLLANKNAEIFTNELNQEIAKFQFNKLEVEIQYSLSNGIHSALILAKEELKND
jgi:hypothetical protein